MTSAVSDIFPHIPANLNYSNVNKILQDNTNLAIQNLHCNEFQWLKIVVKEKFISGEFKQTWSPTIFTIDSWTDYIAFWMR